jgi:hypothetical protein
MHSVFEETAVENILRNMKSLQQDKKFAERG